MIQGLSGLHQFTSSFPLSIIWLLLSLTVKSLAMSFSTKYERFPGFSLSWTRAVIRLFLEPCQRRHRVFHAPAASELSRIWIVEPKTSPTMRNGAPYYPVTRGDVIAATTTRQFSSGGQLKTGSNRFRLWSEILNSTRLCLRSPGIKISRQILRMYENAAILNIFTVSRQRKSRVFTENWNLQRFSVKLQYWKVPHVKFTSFPKSSKKFDEN